MRKRSSIQRLLSGVALAAVLPATALTSAPAGAADGKSADLATSQGIELVTVTAEKRAEPVQKIPVAVTALDADALRRSNVDTLAGIQTLVPDFQYGAIDGSALISVRGIGTLVLGPGEDPGVAVHLDGVYLGRAQYQDAALFDMARVEVLRGPQGTVNGRNATGGTVNLITQEPTDQFGGYANVSVGNYDAIKTSGAVGGPLDGDDLLWRVAWRTDNHEGYTPNINTGERLDAANQQSVRGEMLAKLDDRTQLLVSLDGDHVDTGGYASIVLGTVTGQPLPGVLLGGTTAAGRAVSANDPAYYRRSTLGATARLTVDFDDFVLTSISGYRQLSERVGTDLDGTSFDFMHSKYTRDQNQFSQEVNLVSSTDSPFQWLVGLYYFHEHQKSDETYIFPSLGFDLSIGGPPTTDSYAVYAQASYAVTDKIDVTAGLRYTDDEKHSTEYSFIPQFGVNGTGSLSGSWGALTPKFSADYKPTDDLMFYASASRGFRSGGFNIGGLQGTAFAPEYVWSYEAGAKAQFLDRRLTTNLAVFQSDYSNMQVFQIRNLLSTVENAASATLKGVELEITALPADGLRVDFSGSYLDSRFNKFSSVDTSRASLGPINLAGNQLPRAPKVKLNIGVEKTWAAGADGTFSLRGEYHYTSRVYFSEFNVPLVSQAPVGIWDAQATYTMDGGRYQLSLFGDNLSDETIYTNKLVGAETLGFDIIATAAPPRTFGARLGINF